MGCFKALFNICESPIVASGLEVLEVSLQLLRSVDCLVEVVVVGADCDETSCMVRRLVIAVGRERGLLVLRLRLLLEDLGRRVLESLVVRRL